MAITTDGRLRLSESLPINFVRRSRCKHQHGIEREDLKIPVEKALQRILPLHSSGVLLRADISARTGIRFRNHRHVLH